MFVRLCSGLETWRKRLLAGLPASEVPIEVQRRVLMLVPRLTLVIGVVWLLVATAVLITTSLWDPGGLNGGLHGALLTAGAGGVVTTAVIYFTADLVWRPTIRIFFPDGRLSSVSPPLRPILVRLLIAFLLVGVWLPALLVAASLSQSATLIGKLYTNALFHYLTAIELVLLAVCIIVSVSLALLVTRAITNPVLTLQAAMARVEQNDLEAEVPVTTNDELGYLGERFNQMTAGLREREHIRHMFGQYVTTQVAEAVLHGAIKLGGERTEVTILMTDLRDFTTLCEQMEPEELVALLNRYFDVMIDAVLEFGGTLDKFVGDAIVTVYNAPLPQTDHALRAVLTAVSMRERLARFNRAQAEQGQPVLRMGMGIHSGPAVVGNIGSDGKRVEYTAMGDTVNVAARLEGLTKELRHDVCISEETYQQVQAWVEVDEPVAATVKGRQMPVTVYRLLGLRPGIDPAGLVGEGISTPPHSVERDARGSADTAAMSSKGRA